MNLVKEIVGTVAEEDYRNNFKIYEYSFKQLLRLLAPYLSKKNTVLATGWNFEDLF